MAETIEKQLGSVVSLWRYPVKSMMGEELSATDVTERGVLGDRAYGLVDRTDGKVATAKNPRKWPRLFNFAARFVASPQRDRQMPAVGISLPDGNTVMSDRPDVDDLLSKALDRQVTFRGAERKVFNAEEYWPDMEGLEHRDTVTEFPLPDGTFFDVAMVHLLTTTTLDRLAELYPHGRFDVRRFRPNIVVRLASAQQGFPENAWVGRTLAIGSAESLDRLPNPEG